MMLLVPAKVLCYGGVNKNVKVLRQSFLDHIFSKPSDGFSLYLV